jgi:outer membrane biosynthesis protein TonB
MRSATLASILLITTATTVWSAWPQRPQVFVDLVYPSQALAARQVGVVVVRVATDAKGRVIEAEPLSGPATLRTAAVDNSKRWTLAAGARTDVLVYRFEIDDGLCNDDRRSLFRLMNPNLAVITACSSRSGAIIEGPSEVLAISTGKTPDYPIIARNSRLTGAVVLELSISADGGVESVRALNDLQFFAPIAVAHVQTWRLRTTHARRAFLVYEFALDHRACSAETNTAFWRVTAGVFRLSACSPLVQVD